MLITISPRSSFSSYIFFPLPVLTLLLNLVISSPSAEARSPVLSSRDYITQSSLAKEYDYIVVGGGPAGLVVGSRLTEDSSLTVLVLEAGGLGEDVKDRVETPSEAYYNGLGSVDAYSWGFKSVKQRWAGDREIVLPRARIVGGCTAVNGMYAIKPSQPELDGWSELVQTSTDNASDALAWSWNSFNTAIKKAETFVPPREDIEQEARIKYNVKSHGSSGPLRISYPGLSFPIMGDWIDTLSKGGIEATMDAYNGQNIGSYISALSINPTNWKRSYSKVAYIDNQPPHKNLAILPDATATRLVFESSTSTTVVGVEFASAKDAVRQVVKARKEVIISAGAIGSPHLLMTSGVGPRDVLEAAGVPVKVDLPGVGQHLQDHIAVNIAWDTLVDTPGDMKDSGSEYSKTAEFNSFVNAATAYVNATTIFGSSAAAADFALTITKDIDNAAESTDPTVRAGYKKILQLTADLLTNDNVGAVEMMLNINVAKKASITTSLQRPASQGSVKITSSSIFDKPSIDPQYLSHPADITLLREALKLSQKLGQMEPLSTYMKMDTMVPSLADVASDEAWNKWIVEHASTQYHLSSTSSMLPKELGGVVDSKLRVYGLENVRVIDSSVFPIELSAHLAMSTYGFAEKGVDVILGRVTTESNDHSPSTAPDDETPNDKSTKDDSGASSMTISTGMVTVVALVVGSVFGMLVF